jgi:TPR repeat protein
MGFAPAQAALGWMYAKGSGTLQDYVKAHMWFNIGATGGNAAALEGREFVAARMSPQHIAQAQDMAREAQKKNLHGYD